MTDILQTVDLTKKYSREYANQGICMHVERSSVYGLIGKNGAGKTTLLKQLAGYLHSTGGRIQWYGVQGGTVPRIGAAIGSDRLDRSLTAGETLRLYGEACGQTDGGEAEALLDYFGLSRLGKKKVGSYSSGMKQRLAVALALAGRPELVLLDEPTNGLDPAGIRELREKIREINRKTNTTFIISSHILGELTRIAHCCGILAEGKLIREVRAEKLEAFTMEEKENCFIRWMEGNP